MSGMEKTKYFLAGRDPRVDGESSACGSLAPLAMTTRVARSLSCPC